MLKQAFDIFERPKRPTSVINEAAAKRVLAVVGKGLTAGVGEPKPDSTSCRLWARRCTGASRTRIHIN